MRTFASASLLATAIALATLPALSQRAEASAGVLRCEMPDGTHLYTNTSCDGLGGRSSPLPAEVLSRIRADRRHEARMQAQREGTDVDVALSELDAERMLAMAASVRRPVSSGCAASPVQLASDLQASLQLRDVNRVAESFDWAGMRNEQAQRIMSQLERLTAQRVVDADYFEGQLDAGSNEGTMQFTFDTGGGTVIDDFEVTRHQGCYFLRYA